MEKQSCNKVHFQAESTGCCLVVFMQMVKFLLECSGAKSCPHGSAINVEDICRLYLTTVFVCWWECVTFCTVATSHTVVASISDLKPHLRQAGTTKSQTASSHANGHAGHVWRRCLVLFCIFRTGNKWTEIAEPWAHNIAHEIKLNLQKEGEKVKSQSTLSRTLLKQEKALLSSGIVLIW